MADTTAVQNVQLEMPNINAIQTIRLPPAFCVESYNIAGRAGYSFFGSIEEEAQPINVCIINTKKHNDMYFQIINDTAHILHNRTTWRQILTRKAKGRLNRLAKWRHTGTSLKTNANDIDFNIANLFVFNEFELIPYLFLIKFINKSRFFIQTLNGAFYHSTLII
jgi:hypothetical protein